MSTTPSFSLKLDRAREHLHAFDAEAKQWIESKPYVVLHEADPDPVLHPYTHNAVNRRMRTFSVRPIKDSLPLILGDCVHNVRSSLDHLALALAQRHTPGMTDRQIETSEFPIFYKTAMDAGIETKKIGCIAQTARTLIKSLQPHLRGSNYRDDPLWRIYELDRIDKHRALTLCTMASMSEQGSLGLALTMGQSGVGQNLDRLAFIEVFGCEMRSNAVLARYTAIPLDPQREVKVNLNVTPQVAFAQGGPAPLEAVVPTLDSLCNYVRDTVIAPLTKFL